MDEAGQAHEPECLIPLGLISNSRGQVRLVCILIFCFFILVLLLLLLDFFSGDFLKIKVLFSYSKFNSFFHIQFWHFAECI